MDRKEIFSMGIPIDVEGWKLSTHYDILQKSSELA